jgi:hypothetical protein
MMRFFESSDERCVIDLVMSFVALIISFVAIEKRRNMKNNDFQTIAPLGSANGLSLLKKYHPLSF